MIPDQLRQARVARLERCLEIAAKAVEADPIYAPIFERVDSELAAELAGVSAVERVRASIRARKLAA